MALLGGATGVFVYGLVLLRIDPISFRAWIREDGLPEWLTAGVLALAAVYACVTFNSFRTRPDRKGAALAWLLVAAAMGFAAMEEISWGQRVFGWESPEWFLMHNAQEETNLHNLVLYGVKLNKLVFGKALAVFIVSYVLIFAILYRKRPGVRRIADRLGLPIPRAYQIITWLLALIAVRLSLRLDTKAAELLEFMGSVISFLILIDPYNPEAHPRRAKPIPHRPQGIEAADRVPFRSPSE
jgi:hypothetical protein